MERIIYSRLLATAEKKNALSKMQFGFKKGRPTVDAISSVLDAAAAAIEGHRWRGGSKEYCAVVTLDIKNAFNTASWSAIKKTFARMEALRYLSMILTSYLSDRRLRYHIMFDGVLKLELLKGAKIVGFADDIVTTNGAIRKF